LGVLVAQLPQLFRNKQRVLVSKEVVVLWMSFVAQIWCRYLIDKPG
jgi:hypothetical protein